MTEPRRVLVQLDNLELGGAQINAVQLAAAVAVHGYDSLLIGPRDTIPDEGPSLLDVAADYGVPLEVYDRPASLLAHARVVSGIARRWQPSIVHAFSTSERPAYWGAGRFGRRPLVRTIYEMSYDPRTHPSVPVVIGTRYLLEQLANRQGGAILISPPVDMDRDAPGVTDTPGFRRDLGLAEDAVLVVVVSRLSEVMKAHGIESAIRAIGCLGDLEVSLVVAGTGDAEQRLRSVGQEINTLLGRVAVHFTGPLSDPRPAYDAADIVLGMGSSAARGLAFGKPLIALGEHGWSAVFREPDMQRIFRDSFWSPEHVPDSVSRLAAQIRELAQDRAERARLGAASREFAVANFGLAEMARRLAGVYEQAQQSTSLMTWLGDLRMEALILVAKVERTVHRLTKGRIAQGRVSAAVQWVQHHPVEETQAANGPAR